MKKGINSEQTDMLREIVSIGAGNAATALSQMTKKKISIEVPRVNFVPIENAVDVFGGAETLVTAVYLQILGDLSGVILFSFKRDDAYKLIDVIMGNSAGKTKLLNNMNQSALKETSAILTGAYVGAIAKLLGMKIMISSPGLAQDMAGAIVNAILAETSKEADHAIIIDTELKIVDEKLMSYFFFIPDAASLSKMINVINVKV